MLQGLKAYFQFANILHPFIECIVYASSLKLNVFSNSIADII